MKTLVVAVAGPVGGGKSTLVRGLASRLPDASAIYLDHYERFTQQPIEAVRRWLRDGADPDALAIPRLADDLLALKSGLPVVDPATGATISPRGVLLFETQFGRRHASTGQYIDLLVWIDLPLDIAFARKLRQMAAGFDARDPADAPAFLSWLKTYVENYVDIVGESLRIQRETVRTDADLVVDGMQDPAALLANVETEVLRRLT